MKKAMSNVDVAAMAAELSDRILGGFMGKAYQQSSDRIWLSVQSPAEGRLDLLLVAGKEDLDFAELRHRAERAVDDVPDQHVPELSEQFIHDFLDIGVLHLGGHIPLDLRIDPHVHAGLRKTFQDIDERLPAGRDGKREADRSRAAQSP